LLRTQSLIRLVDDTLQRRARSAGRHPTIKVSSSSPVRAFHQLSSRKTTGNGISYCPRLSEARTYTMAPSSGVVVLFHLTSGIPHPSIKTGSAPSRLVSAFGMTNHFTRHEHEEGPCVRIIKKPPNLTAGEDPNRFCTVSIFGAALPAPGGFRESLHGGGCIHSGFGIPVLPNPRHLQRARAHGAEKPFRLLIRL